MRPLVCVATAAMLCAAVLGGEPADKEKPAQKPVLLILNLRSDFDSGDLGQRAGYSLRAKLRRSDRFSMPDELDLDDLEAKASARPAPDEAAAAARLAGEFGARFVVWGEVTKSAGYTISVKAADTGGDVPEASLERPAGDLREFALACAELADELARHFTGAGYREVYPSKSTAGYTRLSANLVANGDFEKGADSPDSWEKVDGLCSFWDKDSEHSRFIRMDTDVYLSQWLTWRKRFDAGEGAAAAPAKTPTSGDKYDTVAGTYGVHLYSDSIPVKPGAVYAIEFDAKSPAKHDFFFPKAFVKGYAKEGQTTELYNMYKAVRVETAGKWEHFSRVFHPTARTPGVAYMKVMLFAYWPPGEYAFDNVAIYEVRAGEGKAEGPKAALDASAAR